MHPRLSLIDTFSTFAQFDAERFRAWSSDARLRRSMRICLDQLTLSERPENFWVLYWYRRWADQQSQLARGHLTAYLQEAAYWAVHKTTRHLSSLQLTHAHYFQTLISRVDQVLNGFDPAQGITLEHYARSVFSSTLRERLYQAQEVDICTDWALLRKLSKTKLTEALIAAGLAPSAQASRLLAWYCFNTLYLPGQANGTRRLPRPAESTWEAIAALFNAQQARGPLATAQILEQWLQDCAVAVRCYLVPRAVAPNLARAAGPGELSEPDYTSPLSGLDANIAQEEEQRRREHQVQIQAVLIEALRQLEPQGQQLLRLYYQQELSQEIAAQLGLQLSTVPQQLNHYRQHLLTLLVQRSQDTLHLTLTTDLLKATSAVLEDWLEVHYRHPDLQSSDKEPS
ncbi:sigma-70 family RNA polymerase sigma factor [Leptolyngbya sp. FACHB-261]|uniref:sigma-70 family RNA polymerase sigma factor n=1 Tax=Leptolyngbya sp. FACHB-261 TaxID=2692806 RepID=UPI001689B14A|nr:sigma-70 family RNA polymerase sigma factor [Leptolyngbya sp. FACHB-261]MBD2101793.1 sigma-70 family RNA polymerase sigma factor [Leptolyngbya sp. FACHB-261]